ncbi:MAG: 4-alpha-glucanotransferase [Syntrophobacterales bacterium]|nr:4-alpha-glucanotransferase [Syntrophobacterales bacterium]
MEDLLSLLAHYFGILPGYWDIEGKYHRTSMETQRAILGSMGIRAYEESEAHAEIENILEKLRWHIPPVVSIDEGEVPRVSFTCCEGFIPTHLNWTLYEYAVETNNIFYVTEGRIEQSELTVSSDTLGPELWRRLIEERGIRKISFSLPISPSCGYYKLFIHTPSKRDNPEEVLLIVAPPLSFFPEKLTSKSGLAVQLYAVRSERNWGIGDFSDLREIVSIASRMGAGFVGISPLHLLFPENPYHVSPYSPSSRRFLNPWYVAIEEVPEFQEARSLLPDGLLDQLNHYRRLERVDYNSVIPLLYKAFQALYEAFSKFHLDAKTSRAEAFMRFCLERGKTLERYGIFEALRERFKSPWWEWQNQENTHELENRANFFRYLQFISHEQLANVRIHAHSLEVRLYLDLSISVDAGGFDVWYDKDVYTLDARIGAPPDDFNPLGQEWGVVPMVPHKLREANYRPFIETLQDVMRYADILRIDHVMGFFRLFWIPLGLKPAHGAYVRYPMDDMARIVALESVRNRCIVVGEDLGTVPDEVREEMARRRFLSYRVFYFEKHPNGSFKKPWEYPENALATVTTHDLPTFKGYWMERDIDLRAKLAMIDENLEERLREERAKDRAQILKTLSEEGLNVQANDKGPPPRELTLAVHRYLLRTRARLVSFQIDDLIGEEDQPNLPGTTTQYPCWRIRWGKGLEEISSDPSLKEFFNNT